MDWDSTPTEAADSESLRREILKHRQVGIKALAWTPLPGGNGVKTWSAPEHHVISLMFLPSRSSITEASQSFRIPAYNASRETPAQGTRTLRFLGVDPDAEGTPGEQYDFSQLTLSDLLLYTYPWLSGAALALGLAVLAAGHYALSGPHTLRLLPTLAHAALALLGVNFVRGLLTRDSHASLAGSGLATRAADAAATAVHLSAAAHDRLLTARDPALALRSALALWGLTRVGQVLGAWSALTVGFVAAFTLPALAAAHAERLSAAWRALGAAAEVCVLFGEGGGVRGGHADVGSRVRFRSRTARPWARQSSPCMHLGQWALSGHVQSFRGAADLFGSGMWSPHPLGNPQTTPLSKSLKSPCRATYLILSHLPPHRQSQTRSKALGLTRRHKALALVAALTALWLVSGWATRGAALLAGGLAARCHLRPAELDAIAAHAGWGAGRADFDLVYGGVDGAGRAKFSYDASVLLGPPPTTPRPPADKRRAIHPVCAEEGAAHLASGGGLRHLPAGHAQRDQAPAPVDPGGCATPPATGKHPSQILLPASYGPRPCLPTFSCHETSGLSCPCKTRGIPCWKITGASSGSSVTCINIDMGDEPIAHTSRGSACGSRS